MKERSPDPFEKQKAAPTSEEQSVIAAAHTDADPTTFSALPPRDDDEEEAFITVDRKKAEQWRAEQVVVRLLKNIVNVSDVVRLGWRRYASKRLPLEKIATDMSDAEVRADMLVLATLFQDTDHYRNGDEFDGNMVSDGKKTAYYDFELAHEMDPDPTAFPTGYFKNIVSAETLHHYLRKIALIEERVSGSEGLVFLTAVLKDTHPRSAFPLLGKKFKLFSPFAPQFQTLLLEKIAYSRERATQRLELLT